MLIFFKLLLIISLLAIAYQDSKERKVSLWLLMVAFFLTGGLHYHHSVEVLFWYSIFLNIGIVILIITILLIYARLKLKQGLEKAFGFGDLLFFLVIAVGFPTVSFIILFSFSLIFSLIIVVTLKKKYRFKTVPLAGLQALFFSFIFLINWAFGLVNLYQ